MSDLFLDRNRAFNFFGMWSLCGHNSVVLSLITNLFILRIYSWLNSQTVPGTKKVTYSSLKNWLIWLLSFFPGESGLGKSTLINSLFLTDLYSAEYPGPSHRIKKTVQVPLDKTHFVFELWPCSVLKTHLWCLDLIRLIVWGAKKV